MTFDWNASYEWLAAEFRKETGLMAPAKDDPLCGEMDERRREWSKWFESRNEQAWREWHERHGMLAKRSAGVQEPVAQWQYRFFDGVKWVDWANCTELLVKHKEGRDDFQFRALFERARPQPMTQTDSAGARASSGSLAFNYGNALVDKKLDPSYNAQPQPMPQTDAARDAEDAKRYRFIKSQMKVGAVQTQLPLYRTLHWIGYEDCSDVRNADAAIDAEIERLDGAKGE